MKIQEALKMDPHGGPPTSNGQGQFLFYTKGSAGDKF
jgi:hypothetical protein